MPSCVKRVESPWMKHGKKCAHLSTGRCRVTMLWDWYVGKTPFIHTVSHSTPTYLPQVIFRLLQRYFHPFPHFPHPLLLPPLNK